MIGALPTWPHSRDWGYYPSGGLGLVLIIPAYPCVHGKDIASQNTLLGMSLHAVHDCDLVRVARPVRQLLLIAILSASLLERRRASPTGTVGCPDPAAHPDRHGRGMRLLAHRCPRNVDCLRHVVGNFATVRQVSKASVAASLLVILRAQAGECNAAIVVDRRAIIVADSVYHILPVRLGSARGEKQPTIGMEVPDA
jgi:hypothetical protein